MADVQNPPVPVKQDRLPNLPRKPFPFDLEALEAAHKRHWARLERVGMDLNRVAELLEASK